MCTLVKQRVSTRSVCVYLALWELSLLFNLNWFKHTHTHLFGIAYMSLALSRSLAVHLSLSVSWAELHWGGQLLYSQFVSSACLTVLPLTTSQPFGAVHTDHTHLSESHVYRTHSWSLKFTRSRSWNSPDTCLLYNNKEWTQWYNTLNGAQIYNKCLFFCFSRFTAQMQNNCIKREMRKKEKASKQAEFPKISIFVDFMLAVSPDVDSRDVLQIWRWFLGKWTNYLNYKKCTRVIMCKI